MLLCSFLCGHSSWDLGKKKKVASGIRSIPAGPLPPLTPPPPAFASHHPALHPLWSGHRRHLCCLHTRLPSAWDAFCQHFVHQLPSRSPGSRQVLPFPKGFSDAAKEKPQLHVFHPHNTVPWPSLEHSAFSFGLQHRPVSLTLVLLGP